MFQPDFQVRKQRPAVTLIELVYHATVRSIRKTHGNPVIGLLISMLQAAMFVGVFFLMMTFMGQRSAPLRGDFMLFLMTGVFLFMTHAKAVAAVMGAEGPVSGMMLHAPMNTTIAILSSALSSLYTQTIAMVVILFLYHALWNPITIEDPVGAYGLFLLSWISGVAVGSLFLAIKPWFPRFAQIGSQVYRRANMIASGKMFVANALPGYMLAMFDWNPLFHCIDQVRGYVFLNYNPHFSSISYPLYVSLALLTLGLLGEFYTRKQVSRSWSAGK
ncbi:MAG: ABC transporter permease [Rhodobacteraceae bacterium]|nr:ABC transporter permease [Paracoccaceae bacterium]